MVREAFINIGEYTIFMMMAGQGMPTVILEAGAGDDSSTWKDIFPAVAQFTQVMAYDRARLGRSDSAPLPRTAIQLVNDLHNLIQVAQLVGHSLGALLCRLYTQQYRDDVAGLILLDGPHPDQGKRFATALSHGLEIIAWFKQYSRQLPALSLNSIQRDLISQEVSHR